ncbi:MAG TPA: methyltransferase domain-containing protein, partial [Polyangiaceae bacterium]|nr:methyltransferase domain-containing protein [Polyangiaceae bacterium]
LPEFPIGPHAVQDEVVFQSLRCDWKLDESFCFAFADALRPPFAPASFDTVLTSWVIDALDADLEQTMLAIGRVLRPHGTWINVGPLRFDGPLVAAYSLDEVLEMARGCGFEVSTRFTHTVDYFHSPHSGTRRSETVFGFAARKATGVAAPLGDGVRAAWLIDPRQPVTLTAAAKALRKSSVMAIGVLALVDGERSLLDIAQALAAQWRLPPEALVDSLREFLASLADR